MPDTQTDDDAPPIQSNHFFVWMRELDITRQPGWIGGVATGIAARLGIDPLIVRGILVVVAILGGPAVFLYAVAWALLPDTKGVIHAEEVSRGRFSSAVAGIGVLLILSFIPIGRFQGSDLPWVNFSGWSTILGVFWVLLLVGGAVAFAVWIARRADRTPPTVVPADEPALVGPENPDEFAAWREQQEAVKAETEEFRTAQAATEAETAAERAREQRALWEAGVAERAARRDARRRANPRLAAAWNFVILGAALVASGIGAFVASVTTSFTGTVLLAGLACAALVVGIGIAIAGAVRRRSGFLSFVGFVLVLFLVPIAFVPGDRALVTSEYGVGVGKWAQLAGNVYLYVDPSMTGTIDIWQGLGNVHITIGEGAGAHFDGEVLSGYVREDQQGENGFYAGVEPQPIRHEGNIEVYSTDWGNPQQDLTIRLWQGSGSTSVTYDVSTDMPRYIDPSETATPTPTPTESPE